MEHFSEVGVIARRLRIDLDGALEFGDGNIEPAGCGECHAENVMRVGVGGPGLDDLPADAFRLCELAARIKLPGHFDRFSWTYIDPAMLRLRDRILERARAPRARRGTPLPLRSVRSGALAVTLGGALARGGGFGVGHGCSITRKSR